jgi:hypothetical protein
MMGKSKKTQAKLFYHGVSLDRRVPKEHPLRKIKQLVDFYFIRSQVADTYGNNGNQSVDPAVILKLMFLLFYENVNSERALMRQLPLRLDWLWFCDYDLDEDTPDHSVVDDKHEIITSTITTPANTNDDKVLEEAIRSHHFKTKMKAKTVVGDKGYGTSANYEYLQENNITPCIPHKRHKGPQDEDFTSDKFVYDSIRDCYICPAGEKLKRFSTNKAEGTSQYRAQRETCETCDYFKRCVTGQKTGRSVLRNPNARYYHWADGCLPRHERYRLMSRRKYKAEGSFADAANNYGFKQARW